ncbi:MAG: RNA-directed DNA polymerase, partial [Patescibacteria group bacterium]
MRLSKATHFLARERERERERESTRFARNRGVPIGNLTSQIFSNIYLNELDRFVVHHLRPLAYVRYGDDCVVIGESEADVAAIRNTIQEFLYTALHLAINPKNDIIIPVKEGIHFLGTRIYPWGIALNRRNRKKIIRRLDTSNVSSYGGLIRAWGTKQEGREFMWRSLALIDDMIIE